MSLEESEQIRVQKWNKLENEGLCEGNKILIQSRLVGECRFKVACGNKSPKEKKNPLSSERLDSQGYNVKLFA